MLVHGLIVSCQALPNKFLHSSFTLVRLALTAEQADAVGVRTNTKEDII